MKIVDLSFTKSSQTLKFTKIVAVKDGRRFRVRIERNAYDAQSFALVEFWTPLGWTEVVRWPMDKDLETYAASYADPRWKARLASFEADAEQLIARATVITG